MPGHHLALAAYRAQATPAKTCGCCLRHAGQPGKRINRAIDHELDMPDRRKAADEARILHSQRLSDLYWELVCKTWCGRPAQHAIE